MEKEKVTSLIEDAIFEQFDIFIGQEEASRVLHLIDYDDIPEEDRDDATHVHVFCNTRLKEVGNDAEEPLYSVTASLLFTPKYTENKRKFVFFGKDLACIFMKWCNAHDDLEYVDCLDSEFLYFEVVKLDKCLFCFTDFMSIRHL